MINRCTPAAVMVLLMASAVLAQDPVEPPPLPPPLPPVTPSGSPVLVSRQAATTSVVRGEELRSLGVHFLSDGFRIVPGLEITRMSSTEANVSLRGYNDDTSASQGVMALLDRRQVYN